MLYDILRNRSAVWLLKVLHDNEVFRKSYSLSTEELHFRSALSKIDNGDLLLLEVNGLIRVEQSEKNASYSITQKGLKFIQTLDNLKNLLDSHAVEHTHEKKVNIKYDLHDMEKKILAVLYNLGKGKKSVELTDVSKKLYKSNRVPPNVAKHADNLSKMNLIEKKRKDDKVSVALTVTGMRVLNEHTGESVKF